MAGGRQRLRGLGRSQRAGRGGGHLPPADWISVALLEAGGALLSSWSRASPSQCLSRPPRAQGGRRGGFRSAAQRQPVPGAVGGRKGGLCGDTHGESLGWQPPGAWPVPSSCGTTPLREETEARSWPLGPSWLSVVLCKRHTLRSRAQSQSMDVALSSSL